MNSRRAIFTLMVGLLILGFAELGLSESVDYVYDSLNRLIRVEYENGSFIEYSYDTSGNRIIKCVNCNELTQIRAFVTRFYRICLFREPDPGGLNDWVLSLLNGSRSGADVAKGFLFSQEFINRNTSDEEFITILYSAFFDRAPDAGGKAHWLGQLANQTSRLLVVNGFVYSQEFINLCNGYGIIAFQQLSPVEEFVTRFYWYCLDRDPDPAGLQDWSTSLTNGTLTGADVAYGFVLSQEFVNRNTGNEQYLTILYRAFFNRDPDPGGFSNWLNQLIGGASRRSVLDGFIYAQEFSNLCAVYGIRAH